MRFLTETSSCLPREGLRPGVLLRHLQRSVAEQTPSLRLQAAVDSDGARRRGPDPGLQAGHQTGQYATSDHLSVTAPHTHTHTAAPGVDSSAAENSPQLISYNEQFHLKHETIFVRSSVGEEGEEEERRGGEQEGGEGEEERGERS